MPTRPGFDVVPLRRDTKRRLTAMKGERSYDQLLVELLDRSETPPPAPRERPWPEHKQLALADLAAKRWALAAKRGQLAERGPRLVIYRTGMRERRVHERRA